MTSTIMFPYYYHIDEKETEITAIRIYGINDLNENICLRVNNFTPYVYIELPVDNNMRWTTGYAQMFCNVLDEILKDKKPLMKELVMKKKLYGAHLNTKTNQPRLFPFILCKFSNKNDIGALTYKLRTKLFIPGINRQFLFKVHEQDADPILQLLTNRDLPSAGWISFGGEKVKNEQKVTICDHEYKVKWTHLSRHDRLTLATPKIMGFDIETNSSKAPAMSKANIIADKIFQISCVFTRDGSPEMKSYLLSLGSPDEKYIGDDIIIQSFENEWDLLIGFTKLVRTENPNIIVGYNIFGFDLPYMIDRAGYPNNILSKFDILGFHEKNHAKDEEIKWSSSAYKNQKFRYLNAEGRLFVDLLPLIKRDYKLDNYKLKTVSEIFVGSTKDPLTAKGIFKCYRIGTMKQPDGSYSVKSRKAISIVGKYCVMDSILVIKIMQKIQTWTGLCEMATTCNTNMFSLFTQGQQIKVYSQVYKYCLQENIVVEKDGYICAENEKYAGAHVFPPIPGIYDRVIPLDFSSLYPSLIIAYNIDYSTIVFDPLIPDKDCNVFKWSDHFGCIHDEKVIKKNKLTKYIEEQRNLIKEQRELKANTLSKFVKQEATKEIKKLTADLKPYTVERSKIMKTITKNVLCGDRYYRFLKSPKGVMPTILQNLLNARKNTRKQIAENTNKIELLDDEMQKRELSLSNTVLDKRQWAYKISANSVADYTPILCQQNDKICFYRIDQLAKDDWKQFSDDQEVATPLDGILVWSDKGFTKPKFIMRHLNNEPLCRIVTKTSIIDCTNDHSLLNEEGKEIKPSECSIGDKLMHHNYHLQQQIDILSSDNTFDDNAFQEGKLFAKNKTDLAISVEILNGDLQVRQSFLRGFYSIQSDLCINGFLRTASFIFLLSSFGYNVQIGNTAFKCFNLICPNAIANENSIIEIEPIDNQIGNFVYDIETENNHFHGGIGNMIVHNSMYGAMGVRRGYLPFMPGAMCTTFMGRTSIELVAKTIPEKYGGELVYGDSVTADTPVLCRINGKIYYRTIDDLPNRGWETYRNGKEIANPVADVEIWTENGFTKIKKIIKHKTKKEIYRVLTNVGVVDVTEDHGLLDSLKNKISPKEIKVGSKLLISDLPLISKDEEICISQDLAFVLGLFYADGSCDEHGDKSSWVINKNDRQILEKCKNILNNSNRNSYYELETLTFQILETVESSKILKLVPVGKGINIFVDKWRHAFYDNNKYKKVPDEILWASDEIRQAFLDGYYSGDGDKDENGYCQFDNKGKIGSASLYLLASSLGYKVSITTKKDNPLIYRLTCTKTEQIKQPNIVKKIELLGKTEQYVYDLETENHHFSAGIGELIVHNTDSNYIHFSHLKTAQETWEYSEYVAAEVSKLFPPPMKLEFEKVIYWRFFILTKKRYMYKSCGEDGIVQNKVGKKGVLLARRDNSLFIRKFYEQVISKIFDREDRDDVLYFILEYLNRLFGYAFPHKDFVITKQIGSTESSRSTGGLGIIPEDCIDEKTGKINKKKWKIGDYKVPRLSDDPKERASQLKKKDAISDIDFYEKSLPAQVYLSQKMRKRGQTVQAGSRLEYVVADIDNHGGAQFEKLEDLEYFNNHSDLLNIDFYYYLENAINPFDEALNIAYGGKNNIGYKYPFKENFLQEQFNFRYKIRRRVIEEIKNFSRVRIIFE